MRISDWSSDVCSSDLPEESMKTIYLPQGYHLELVASEPMISEPVAIAWDGNGRMYVAEMNTYMKDADGNGQNVALSKIVRLEDRQSVVSGKSVSVRVDLGGRRIFTKKNNTYQTQLHTRTNNYQTNK